MTIYSTEKTYTNNGWAEIRPETAHSAENYTPDGGISTKFSEVLQTISDSNTTLLNTVKGLGYITASDADTIISAKGYQTESSVRTVVASYGYQTASDVEALLVAKGYQTSGDVQNTIAAAGYITSTSASTSPTVMGYKRITVSADDPSGGLNGDLWFKVA